MTKDELVTQVAAKASITKVAAATSVDATIGAITDALAKGDKLTLIGFGTFQVKARAAREGRNPRTGGVLKIEAKKLPSFTAGKALKEAVAGPKKK